MLKLDLIFKMITTKIFMQLRTMGQVKLILRTDFFSGEISDKNIMEIALFVYFINNYAVLKFEANFG